MTFAGAAQWLRLEPVDGKRERVAVVTPSGNLERVKQHDAGAPESPGVLDQGTLPSGFGGLLDSCGVGIHVLSTDADLLETTLRVSGAHASIYFVEDWPELTAAIDQGHCGIVLLDMDRVGAMLDMVLGELERRAARPVVVAAGSNNDAPELMRAVAARRIHRLMIKPASPGKVRLLLEAAINRSLQLRDHASQLAAAGARPGVARLDARAFIRRRGLMIGAVMALVFLAFVVAGLMKSPPGVTVPEEEPQLAALPVDWGPVGPPIEEPIAGPDPFAVQLEQAQAALEAGRLVEPPDDNALDGYAAILAVEPDHELASEGLAATMELLFTWVESALLGDELELASTMLDHARRVRPESMRLEFLDAQLERSRQEQAETERAAAQPRELNRLVALSEGRMQRGQLARPAGDNALSHYRRAAALDAADPAVVALRLKLGAALVAATRQLLDAGDTGQAEALITEARNLGVDTAVLADLDQRLIAVRDARQQEREAEMLALGLERLREGQLIAPESDSAVFYLTSLKAENLMHPGLQEPWDALITMLEANFRESLAAADWSAAESWLAGLGQVESDSVQLALLTAEMTVARRQAAFLDAAAPADQLKLLDYRAPSYPEAALRRGTEGWVDLEFIVGRDGRPREIVVAEAEPAGAFDRAAINAVTRYRYEPFEADGVTYERLVRLRLRFALQ